VDELTALLNVRDKLNIAVRELSLGERMKMELIAALLHQPRVLFLDEPTLGLDVVSQKIVRDFLRDYNARRRTTILLTSHYMADIEALCRRVIIIDHGRIFFDGLLADVLDRFADSKIVTLQCAPAASFLSADLQEFGEVLAHDAATIRLKIKRDRVIPACKELLEHLPVADIDIQEVPIEEVIGSIFTRP
jgi:ABC-2 type transport system ATP-binding protein